MLSHNCCFSLQLFNVEANAAVYTSRWNKLAEGMAQVQDGCGCRAANTCVCLVAVASQARLPTAAARGFPGRTAANLIPHRLGHLASVR